MARDLGRDLLLWTVVRCGGGVGGTLFIPIAIASILLEKN